MKPVIFADVHLCVESAQLRLRQRALGVEVEQLLPVAAEAQPFSCRVKCGDAMHLADVDFSPAPRLGVVGSSLWVEPARALGARISLPAARAQRFDCYQVRLRDLPPRTAVESAISKAVVRAFQHKGWGVVLTPERALLIAKLIDAWQPRAYALGDTASGVLLKGGMFTILFLDAPALGAGS